jgi:hypothetical protein
MRLIRIWDDFAIIISEMRPPNLINKDGLIDTVALMCSNAIWLFWPIR